MKWGLRAGNQSPVENVFNADDKSDVLRELQKHAIYIRT
jgi:hypothetical protein